MSTSANIHHHQWAFIFGILGNIVSIMVCLAPLPTFYRIYKEKATEGFQSIPYVVSLFSAMLWISYAVLKTDAFLLITINSIGCVIETIYILIFLIDAPKSARLPNVAGFVFGVLQMLMYAIYKNKKKVVVVTTEEDKDRYHENNKIPTAHGHQHVSGNKTTTTTINGDHVIRINTMGSAEVHPIDLQMIVLDHTHHLEKMQQQQVIDQQDDKNMEVVEV
ncbi:hypothetical protein MKX01_029839 [Papaver californicum]|nr:hypothetical protein MKX01_029839 [Papaver californicum]